LQQLLGGLFSLLSLCDLHLSQSMLSKCHLSVGNYFCDKKYPHACSIIDAIEAIKRSSGLGAKPSRKVFLLRDTSMLIFLYTPSNKEKFK
jgi:hypothetical protein